MSKLVALLLGVLAWVGVAALAVLITFNIGDKNEWLMLLPILAAVMVAWAVGEYVTERVFGTDDERGVQ